MISDVGIRTLPFPLGNEFCAGGHQLSFTPLVFSNVLDILKCSGHSLWCVREEDLYQTRIIFFPGRISCLTWASVSIQPFDGVYKLHLLT